MFLHIVAALAGFLLVVPPPTTIELEGGEVDVEAIGQTVLGVDPDDLLDALEEGIPDRELPNGFVNPPAGELSMLEEISGGGFFDFTGSDLPGQIGTTRQAFDTDPDVVPELLAGGEVSYVLFDREVTRAEMRLMQVGFESTVDDLEDEEDITDASVDAGELGGVDILSASVTYEVEGANGVLHILVVPIGNVLLFGTTMVIDFGEVDAAAVERMTLSLTAAAIQHLGDVADELAGE